MIAMQYRVVSVDPKTSEETKTPWGTYMQALIARNAQPLARVEWVKTGDVPIVEREGLAFRVGSRRSTERPPAPGQTVEYVSPTPAPVVPEPVTAPEAPTVTVTGTSAVAPLVLLLCADVRKLQAIHRVAIFAKLDFSRMVAAHVLGVRYADVTETEREEAHNAVVYDARRS